MGQSLGQEDALAVGRATHSSILAWRIPTDREAWRAAVHRVAQSWTDGSDLACMHAGTEDLGSNPNSAT